MTLTYTLPARPRGNLWRFIVDRNPFYLLSALCMLTGCILLTNARSFSPISHYRLLILIATLNIYEALLIGLAIGLIARRGLARDGAILLGIEAFFLVDTTFLNAEIFSVDLRLGIAINAILFILAFCKLAVIFKGLRLRGGGVFVLILAQLAVLFALPGMFKQIAGARHGTLPPLAIYAAWWGVGMMPVLAMFLLRGLPMPRFRRIVNLFAMFAFASLVLHLSLDNWIYKVQWHNANLSPLMLGLAMAVGGCERHVLHVSARMRTQLLLPIVALYLSATFSPALMFTMGGHSIALTPLRLAFIGAMIVYLHGLLLHRHAYFAFATAACFGAAGLGATSAAIVQNLQEGWNFLVAGGRRLIPRTGTHWGILSVIGSFVLLALGALISVLKGRSATESIASADGEDRLLI